MLVTYVDRCTFCDCSSLRDEGGRRPVPGLASCPAGGTAGCPCHDAPPAALARSARASAAALGNDAARFRLFRRGRAASAHRPSAAR